MGDGVEALQLPLALNIAAVFVGALLGAIRAGDDEDVDVVGMLVLAACVGFGGGVLRDILLGNLPPAAFVEARYLIAAVVAAGLGALFVHYLRRLGPVLWVLDSLSIGLFAVVGTNAALLAGLQAFPAIVIGTIASVGGLVLADILQNRPVSILYFGPPNAIAGLAGSAAYTAIYAEGRQVIATVVAVLVAFAARLTGPVFNVRVPRPRRSGVNLRAPLNRLRRTAPGETTPRRARIVLRRRDRLGDR